MPASNTAKATNNGNQDTTVSLAKPTPILTPSSGIFGVVDNKVYKTGRSSQNINLTNYTFNLPYNSYVFISASGRIWHTQLVSEGVSLYLDDNGVASSSYDFVTNTCYSRMCTVPFQVQTVKYMQKGNHKIQLVGGAVDNQTSFGGMSIAVIENQNGNIELRN